MPKLVLKLLLLTTVFFLCCFALTASEKTELVFWNFWDPKFILPVIKSFEQQHPNITIHNEQISWNNGLDKIIVAMANNRAPDICEFGSTWMGKFMAEDSLIDLTKELSDLKPDYLMWEAATYNNRTYGMPWLAGTRVLFYNKKLFANAGLDPQSPPTTWEEMLNAAKAIHNPEKGIFGYGLNAGEGHILYKKFMPFVWANGGKIFDEEDNFVFDNPQTRAAIDFHLELKKFSYCEKQDLLDEAFKKERLGMLISGSWNFANYPVDAPNLDFSVALIPKPSNNTGISTSFLGGEILSLFNSCKNKEAAVAFIRYLAKAENTFPITQEALVSFPAHKDAYKDSFLMTDNNLVIFVEQMKTAIHPPIHPLWIEVEKIINDSVEHILYGDNPDLIFSNATKDYNQIKSRYIQAQSRRSPSNNIKTNFSHEYISEGNYHIVLLTLIAIGTLINVILLSFLLLEVKKKA